MIDLKQELAKLNIESICIKCKSCLSELKCLKHLNGTYKFVCPNHDIIENELVYFYEIKLDNNRREIIRKPNYDVTTKLKPISFCFSYKTNNCCRMNDSCLFPHSLNEQNIWELLRKLKIKLDDFMLEILKANNQVEDYNPSYKVYSLSSDLQHLIKTKNLKRLQVLLSLSDEKILFTENKLKQTILHMSSKLMSKKITKFLLDYEKLSACFGGKKNLSLQTFTQFINHKDKNYETALSLLLKTNTKSDKLNQVAILFFNTKEYNLKQLIGSSCQQTTLMHRLIETKNLSLIQYLCFNFGDQIDLTKLKNSNNLSSKSLASLNTLTNNDKETKKINDTINACIIAKIIRNYVTIGMNTNDELINENDLDSIEFGFKKFKFII